MTTCVPCFSQEEHKVDISGGERFKERLMTTSVTANKARRLVDVRVEREG